MDRLEPTDMAIEWKAECIDYGNKLGINISNVIPHAIDKADQQPTRVKASLSKLVGNLTADCLINEIGDHTIYLGILRLVCKRLLSMKTPSHPTQGEKRSEYCERLFTGYIISIIGQKGREPGLLNKEIASMVISLLADKYF